MLGLYYAIRLSPMIEKRLATLFTPSPSRVGHPGDPYSLPATSPPPASASPPRPPPPRPSLPKPPRPRHLRRRHARPRPRPRYLFRRRHSPGLLLPATSPP